jgi:sec-independent protein translocase protein TatA
LNVVFAPFLAPGILGLGVPEILIICAVIVLIFGVSKVGDIGGALGKSVREFRREAKNDGSDDEPEAIASSSVQCTNCGEQISGEAKFCAKCGAPRQATVS